MQKRNFFLFFIFLFFPLFPAAAGNGYEVSDSQVFYEESKMEAADAASFQIINDDFALDKNYCFYKHYKLQSCQLKSFTYLGDAYSKDSIQAYYKKDRIEDSEGASFFYLDGKYAKDRLGVYYEGVIVKEGRPDSFSVLSHGYAKDADYVYKDGELIPEADPGGMEVINEEYFKNNNKVFYLSEAVEDADPSTFKLMSEGYARDKSYFFRYGKALAKITNKFYNRYEEKDLSGTCRPEMISEEASSSREFLSDGFSAGKECIFYKGSAVENSEPLSFEKVAGHVYKDNNFVYHISEGNLKKAPFAHAPSFVSLNEEYFKDSYAVYYGENLEIINGVDIDSFEVACKGENCSYEAKDKNRFYKKGMETALDEKTQQLLGEAGLVFKSADNLPALLAYNNTARDLAGEAQATQKFLDPIMRGVYGVSDSAERSLVNFILYGTETTRALGSGERAGVVNSYKTAFGKLPATEQEWSDLIKIANGRWPTERNEVAEERAERRFRYIYQRAPYSFDEHDNAAITIMAYGLRTAKRNIESEKAAILTFRKMFLEYPLSASDWDMARAIAYSGASR